MGCGSSIHRGVVEPTPEESVSNPPPVTENWATKRTVSTDPITTNGDHLSSPQNDVVNLKQDNSMSLIDADDDEIEIIYESAPKKQPERFEPQLHMRTAANGQEPPEANEIPQLNSPMNKPKTETKPLSKQQQEEAAKLAQRRRTFDNQKYQQSQYMSCEVVPFGEVPGAVHQEEAPRNMYTNKSQHSPTTDMILGLNAGDMRTRDQPQLNAFLPGGILDDLEDFRPVPQVNKMKQRKTHDDIESAGFDADDEKLMTEILEDFDM